GPRADGFTVNPLERARSSGVEPGGVSQSFPVLMALEGSARLLPGTSALDIGFVDGYTAGNRVWRDDGDGVRGGAEPGLAGVLVQLLDRGGSPLLMTSSDANGYYRFDLLPAGRYTVALA